MNITERLRTLARNNATLHALLDLQYHNQETPDEEWFLYAIEVLVLSNNALFRQCLDAEMRAPPKLMVMP